MNSKSLLLGLLALCSIHLYAAGGVVDDMRLPAARADADNWLTYGRDYSDSRP